MRVKDLVDKSFLNIPGFEESMIDAFEYVNLYTDSHHNDLFQLRPTSLDIALKPFRIIKVPDVKLVLIGLEPPHTNIFPKNWYYTGIPFDTPIGVTPLKSTLIIEEVFPPSTFVGCTSRLEAVVKQYGILFYNCQMVAALGVRELFLPGFLKLTKAIVSHFTYFGIPVAIVNERLHRLVKGKVNSTYLYRMAPPCPSCQMAFRRDIATLLE